MSILWFLLVLLFVAFLMIVLRGAPYVPTRRDDVRRGLKLLDVPKGSTVIDLGSGDGVVLKEAARQGYRAIGYELNPFLCLISYIRCWQYREQVSVRWRDFWLTPLPPETDAVFVFLAGPYLKLLNRKLTKERNPAKRLRVVSYGFLIPGKEPVQKDKALLLYEY